ncbi:MAG TPA: glycosyltransferase family 8 protein [Candidatus Methanoperedens sp.]|nr:glycosyltransferase family 8 protein [Candidatus Methanoperedens sp.]
MVDTIIEGSNQKRTYVTLLVSDGYLPGILVLAYSLRVVGSRYPFLVIATPNISQTVFAALDKQDVKYKIVEPITYTFLVRPLSLRDSSLGRVPKIDSRFLMTYTKLRIWELVEFDKMVFIDGDMLVCSNIDDLFDKQVWSAVNAGGELLAFRHWVDLNSGLMVIEPDKALFSDMMGKINMLHFKDYGDQGFLHTYFPEWPKRKELHLPHGYNMAVGHIDSYVKELGYGWPYSSASEEKKVKALHYWGKDKPWVIPLDKMNLQLANEKPYYFESMMLWYQHYCELMSNFGSIPRMLRHYHS